VIDTNLNSMFNVTKQVVPAWCEKGWGRIIQISSVNGEKGQAGQTNYSAAKAGMHGFTMALAQEVATKGVTVNTVSPGYIGTDMVRPSSPRCWRRSSPPSRSSAWARRRKSAPSRLAGGRGFGLHHRRRLQLQRRPAHGLSLRRALPGQDPADGPAPAGRHAHLPEGRFLCAARGVSLGIYFQQKLSVGFFGGEGFIMQKLEGDGLAFVHAAARWSSANCSPARP
jgi:hypothetical protein